MATKKKKEEAKSAVATRKSLCISINLLPREYRKPVKDFSWITDRRVVWPTIALIAVVISVVMMFSFIEETLSGLNQELERVKAEVERERPLLTKISDLEQKQGVINTKINALKSIQVSKKRWVILFENVSSVLPPNMWLTSLNQLSDNELEMRGTTFDFSEVAEYMVKLEKQVSVEKVSLVNIATSKVEGEEAYTFTIKVLLKQDLGMEG
jgi:type IV pilus assembly protein PilN